MTTIPMCWKCKDAILENCDDKSLAKKLVGCKRNKQITDYYYAKIMCPIINR